MLCDTACSMLEGDFRKRFDRLVEHWLAAYYFPHSDTRERNSFLRNLCVTTIHEAGGWTLGHGSPWPLGGFISHRSPRPTSSRVPDCGCAIGKQQGRIYVDLSGL